MLSREIVERQQHLAIFGFNLSLWDRLLGTYVDQPAKGHRGMEIGLPDFREAKWRSLHRLLVMPLNRRAVIGARCAAKKPK